MYVLGISKSNSSFLWQVSFYMFFAIRDPCHSHAFKIAHMVNGLSLHIHSFIHLRDEMLSQHIFMRGRNDDFLTFKFSTFQMYLACASISQFDR